MKIIKRIPCKETYAFWEVEFDNKEELANYKEIRKALEKADSDYEKDELPF
jgi:hypothetical protein